MQWWRTQETEAGKSLEFQDSLIYTEKPCLKKQKQKKTKQNQKSFLDIYEHFASFYTPFSSVAYKYII